jgi:hypothetical protein
MFIGRLPLSDLAPDRVLAAEVRIFLVQHLAIVDGLRSAVEPDRAGGENLDLLQHQVLPQVDCCSSAWPALAPANASRSPHAFLNVRILI